MGSLALEPDFVLEAPDIQRDYETHTAKRKLIEPVVAAGEAMKRKPRANTSEKLRRLHSDDIPVTIKEKPKSLTGDDWLCKIISPFFQQFAKFDKIFIGKLTKLMDALWPFD